MLVVLLVLSFVGTAALIWAGRPRPMKPTPVVPEIVEEESIEAKVKMLDEIFGTIRRDDGDEDPPTVVMDTRNRRRAGDI